jgi:hypothetical protein
LQEGGDHLGRRATGAKGGKCLRCYLRSSHAILLIRRLGDLFSPFDPLLQFHRIDARGTPAQLHHWQAIMVDKVIDLGAVDAQQGSHLRNSKQLGDGGSRRLWLRAFSHRKISF